MEDLEQYLSPLNWENIFPQTSSAHFATWGEKTEIYLEEGALPKIDSSAKIAIVGIGEDRASANNKGCAFGPEAIRKEFYALMPQQSEIRIIDLGNIRLGKSVQDTYFATAEVVRTLLENNILPVILGGSNDVCIGVYMAYIRLEQIINLLNIDSKFDLSDDEEPISDENYIHKLLCNDPNYLFDYSHIAYQSYFVDKSALELMDSLRFEYHRLGQIQNKIEDMEPIVRDADMLVADINAIRASDSPCSRSPHGLYGEEFCKLINYAGMSDKLTSLCLCGTNPETDSDNRTAQIVAHALYYFIDGYLWRKKDYPYLDKENYRRFFVQLEECKDEIVFYKSKKSSRWWVEVPCSQETQSKYIRHYIVPCLYEDYLAAMKGEVPPRWLIAYNKINL